MIETEEEFSWKHTYDDRGSKKQLKKSHVYDELISCTLFDRLGSANCDVDSKAKALYLCC